MNDKTTEEALKVFARSIPRLAKPEVDDLLLYLKTILAARRSYRGKVQPPSADQWEHLSYWQKWSLFASAVFWAFLADVNHKVSRLPWA
jgi:hypothetical protein